MGEVKQGKIDIAEPRIVNEMNDIYRLLYSPNEWSTTSLDLGDRLQVGQLHRALQIVQLLNSALQLDGVAWNGIACKYFA